jgi:hypothetical protein
MTDDKRDRGDGRDKKGRWVNVRIPMKAATDSDGKRPPVPIQNGHFGRGVEYGIVIVAVG